MNKSNIKNYNLISLETNKQLGVAVVSDSYDKIELKVSLLDRQTYAGALARMIENLKATGAFPLVYVKDLTVRNGSADFWAALKQSLFTNLKIVVSGDAP
jgi:hypothetical protein